MSAKNVIQKLQDSQLIRLFLQFVQTYHYQYEKICKEISYKCYEATWSLTNLKATGYGRTESQAFKHALRNLLELLIQEPSYVQFFIQALNNSSNHNNKAALIKKQPLNQYNSNYAKKIVNIKTQGHQPQQKHYINQNNNQNQLKILHNSTKLEINNNNGKLQLNTNDKLINQNINYKKQNYQQQKLNKIDSQSKFRTLNNNNNNYQFHDNNLPKRNGQIQPEQLRKALQKLNELQNYLTNINQQNQYLKSKLRKMKEQQIVDKQNSIVSFIQNQNMYEQQLDKSFKNKPSIPKLKLQILPNYHKKSQKSLNQSLLAAYNEKRNPSVKKIIC